MRPIKALWQSIKAATRSTMRFSRSVTWFFGWSELGQSDFERWVGNGFKHNVLMTPLLWIARTFPEAPLVVRKELKDGKREINRRHPMIDAVRRPNAFYTGDSLWMATLLSFLTDGNAYWFKVRGARGRVAELWYLPHWQVNPHGSETEFITHYVYRPDSTEIKIAPEDMVHFRYGIDPEDPRKGFSLLKTLLVEIFGDQEAGALVAYLLKNKGVPGLVISPDPSVVLAPGDEQTVKDYIDDKFGGPNRGKPMVLGAATKVQQFGFNPQEMNLGGVRGVSEERVCAALGLPVSVVGFASEHARVGATLKEMIKLAWTGCIIPINRMFAEELSRSLLPDFSTDAEEQASFDHSEVEAMQASMVEAAQAVQIAVSGGVMTRAEGRQRLGLESLPVDEVFYTPFNAIVTPRDAEPLPPAPEPTPAPGDEPKKLPAPGKKAQKRLTKRQAAILRASDQIKKRAAAKLHARVADFLRRYGHNLKRAWLQVGKSEDQLRLQAMFSRADTPAFKSELRSILATHYVSIYHEQRSMLGELGIGVDLPDSAQIDILTRGGSQAGLIDLEDQDKAMRVLTQARSEGLGVDATAKRLADEVPAGRFLDIETRAALIARTETRIAQTESALMMYRSADGIDGVVMIDGRLGPTDADCEAMDGEPATFDEAEGLIADEHPNGTRDLVPAFMEA